MESRLVLFLLAVFTGFCCLGCAGSSNKKLIVILVDGVRWDYIKDSNLKGIQRIADHGVKAPYVIPVFPSLSYPNWLSLFTGLYAENHGFVSNYMFDTATNTSFRMIPDPGASEPYWWDAAEPIWITAEKNNKRAALYWWAGCEVKISGAHPTVCERYMEYISDPEAVKADFLERTDDIIELLTTSKGSPSDRLSLALMYHEAVDYTGHRYGPDSSERKRALRNFDDILNGILNKIQKAGLKNEVNIMVVSDHGMTDARVGIAKRISLDKYASKIMYQKEYGPITTIFPRPGMLEQLYQDILKDKIEGLQIYKKEEIPEKFHLKNSVRTAPLVLIARKGYLIKLLTDEKDKIPAKIGYHGYDPDEVEDMRTVFFASGPDFKKGVVTDVLRAVDLYNVMCRILQIPPLPNNGSWDRVSPMLKNGDQQLPVVNNSAVTTTYTVTAILLTLFTVISLKYL